MTTTRVITPPAADVLSLAEACAQARIEVGMDDATIQRYVRAATRHLETLYGVPMITQTKELVMDEWPEHFITLTDHPVQSITSIKFTLDDDSEQTWSNTQWVASLKSQPVRIAPKDSYIWPFASSLRDLEAVAVQYVAGFGNTSAAVPEPIRQAVALLAADWYIRREDTGAAVMSRRIENGVHTLMAQWR